MAETNKWMKMLSGAAKFLPVEAPWVAIVMELVSHLTASMGATSNDSKEVLRHIEGLHGEVTEIAASHLQLGSKLEEQTVKLATQVTALNLVTKSLEAAHDELTAARDELAATRTTTEGLRVRMEKMEKRATLLGGIGLVLLVVVCALTIVLVVHLRR
jgi:chromosome segregation ATPase